MTMMGWGGWGWVSMLLMVGWVWVPIVALIAWLVTRAGRGSGGHEAGTDSPDAAELARRAYVRGQISRERYLQLIEDLPEPHLTVEAVPDVLGMLGRSARDP